MVSNMELRPYQKEDAEIAIQKGCLGIFNEQRTGKTPTTIHVANELGGRVLIVCTKSMLSIWQQ